MLEAGGGEEEEVIYLVTTLLMAICPVHPRRPMHFSTSKDSLVCKGHLVVMVSLANLNTPKSSHQVSMVANMEWVGCYCHGPSNF